MGSSPANPSRLTELQRLVLDAFFAREQAFYLTGGAALAGYHLGHRQTDDLDLFTSDKDAFERSRFVLADVAAELNSGLQIVQDAPGFLRAVLTRNDEALVIDLVRERSFQLHAEKLTFGTVRVDPADEILANKLTAIVGRAEERDLVDVYALEQRAALRVEDALPAALQKDGGCTPANLAWLLSEVRIPDEMELPGGVAVEPLRAWLGELVKRLRRCALPSA